ncbi:alanyl-tRNA editing protein [Inquilinus limosus]|uniref:Alanine--tRNA ligase n=1 Tax=Inquilinus limosus TaxID=171674 RepID=A0A211Z9Z3_9PROT|nr:alanyl-tRNA editing protein [Inquilinus limosus]OWJ62081.1 Ala-tRNA(Pro) hydrolase [Inquilinus limosus]
MTELLFRDDAYAREATATVVAATPEGIVLDRTVFYATAGGQPGDTGAIRWAGGEAAVAEARKGATPDEVRHLVAEGSALPAPGTPVALALDWERRYRHMRMHTALHLLCVAIPGDVTGGQIGAERSRLDFNLPGDALDAAAITAKLNELVAAALPIETEWITDEEMAARPELVRTMSVKPPSGFGRVRLVRIGDAAGPVDLQPCGGTHVRNTSEIGALTVAKIENKGKQNRRVVITFAGEA